MSDPHARPVRRHHREGRRDAGVYPMTDAPPPNGAASTVIGTPSWDGPFCPVAGRPPPRSPPGRIRDARRRVSHPCRPRRRRPTSANPIPRRVRGTRCQCPLRGDEQRAVLIGVDFDDGNQVVHQLRRGQPERHITPSQSRTARDHPVRSSCRGRRSHHPRRAPPSTPTSADRLADDLARQPSNARTTRSHEELHQAPLPRPTSGTSH